MYAIAATPRPDRPAMPPAMSSVQIMDALMATPQSAACSVSARLE